MSPEEVLRLFLGRLDAKHRVLWRESTTALLGDPDAVPATEDPQLVESVFRALDGVRDVELTPDQEAEVRRELS